MIIYHGVINVQPPIVLHIELLITRLRIADRPSTFSTHSYVSGSPLLPTTGPERHMMRLLRFEETSNDTPTPESSA